MTILVGVLMALAAYLIGAVPIGVLLARRRGVDLREVGSGNIGATNLGRALGKKWGLVCLLLDITKGLAPTAAAGVVLRGMGSDLTAGVTGLWVAVGLAAVLGHVFPVYLQFRGGKGVATSIGVGLGLFPYFSLPMLAAVVCYFAVRLVTGYVSAGSLTLAVTFPVWFIAFSRWFDWPMERCWPLLVVAAAVGLLIILRHRDNITRLLQDREHSTQEN